MEEVELRIDEYGTKRYFIKGTNIRHRENGPATEGANGDKYWFQYDKRHRLDGPAIEYANGSKFWLQYGKYHRLDGPAIEWHDDKEEFWINGIHIPNVNSIEEAMSCGGDLILIKSLLE